MSVPEKGLCNYLGKSGKRDSLHISWTLFPYSNPSCYRGICCGLIVFTGMAFCCSQIMQSKKCPVSVLFVKPLTSVYFCSQKTRGQFSCRMVKCPSYWPLSPLATMARKVVMLNKWIRWGGKFNIFELIVNAVKSKWWGADIPSYPHSLCLSHMHTNACMW